MPILGPDEYFQACRELTSPVHMTIEHIVGGGREIMFEDMEGWTILVALNADKHVMHWTFNCPSKMIGLG